MASNDDDDEYAEYIYMQVRPPSSNKQEDAGDYEFEDESNDTYVTIQKKKDSVNEARSPLPLSPPPNDNVYMTCAEAEQIKEKEDQKQTQKQRDAIQVSLSDLCTQLVMCNDDIQLALKFLENPSFEVAPDSHSILRSNWRDVASLSTQVQQIFISNFRENAIDHKADVSSLTFCYRLILSALTRLFRESSTLQILSKYATGRHGQQRTFEQLMKQRKPSPTICIDPTRPTETLHAFLAKPEHMLTTIVTQLEGITTYAPGNLVQAVIDVRSAAKTALAMVRRKAKTAEQQEQMAELGRRLKFDPEKWPTPNILAPDRYLLFAPTKLLLISKLPRDDAARSRCPFSFAAVLDSASCMVTLYLFNDVLLIAYSTRKSDDLLALSLAKRSDVELLEPEVEDDWYSAILLRLRIKEDQTVVELLLNTREAAECRKWKEALTVYEGLSTVKSVFGQAAAPKLTRSNTNATNANANANANAPPPTPPRRRGSEVVHSARKKEDEVDVGDANKVEKRALELVLLDCMLEIADLRSRTPDKPCRRLLQETSKLKGSAIWSQLEPAEQNVQELMFEVLVTEMTYFHNLHILVWGLFYRADFRDALSAMDFKNIVSHVPAVYEISGQMLHALAQSWREADCKLLPPKFLRVVKRFVSKSQFEQVYPNIITDQEYQVNALEELLSQKHADNRRSSINVVPDGAQPVTDPVMLRWLVQKFENSFPAPVHLRDLLLLPFNRLTKLHLLLKTIREKAKAGSEVQTVAGEVESKLHDLLTRSNERKRIIENRARFIKLCDELDGKQPFVQLDVARFHSGRHSVEMQDVFTWARVDEVGKERQFDKLFRKGPLMNAELILLDDSLMLGVRKKNGKLTVVDYVSLEFVKFSTVDSSVDDKLDGVRKAYAAGTSARASSQRRHSEVPITHGVGDDRAAKASNLSFRLATRTGEFTLQATLQAKYITWKNLLTKQRR